MESVVRLSRAFTERAKAVILIKGVNANDVNLRKSDGRVGRRITDVG